MTKSLQTSKSTKQEKTSELDRFSLSFEYDKTLQELKRDVRSRTIT